MPDPLEEIQDAILDKLHAGEPVDRDAILASHPEHAEALKRFFALTDDIERPLAPVAPDPSRLGEFRIVKEIGRGGMGIVYEAQQESLNRRVALKVLPAVQADKPRVVARFQREAEAAGRLRHPNIVPVYSVGQSGGVPFFAMEMVDGRSLADVLQARARGEDDGLPPAGDAWRRWVLELVARIADALSYAHGEGILHRDVKPANILLEQDGTPRLTDFGLALDLDSPGLTVSGETLGTPLYMSPEQAIRKQAPLDQRTDVYSLGVTLYETLTLRTPYAGESTLEVLAALSAGDVVPPRKVDPTIPPPVQRVVLRALELSADDRYATMAEFAADLRALLSDRALAPAPPKITRLKGRRPGRLVIASGLIVVAAVIVFRPRDKAPDPQQPMTASRLTLLASGRLGDDGAAVLEAWVRPQVNLREYIRREEDLKKNSFTFEIFLGDVESDPDHPPDDVQVIGLLESSIDGSPWQQHGFTRTTLVNGSGHLQVGHQTLFGRNSDARSVRVRHRAKIRIQPRFRGKLAEAWGEPYGAEFTWTEDRVVHVVDAFPDNYPPTIDDPSLDARIRASVTPRHFAFTGNWGSSGGKRTIHYFTGTLYGLPPADEIPVAFAVDVMLPGDPKPIGTGRFVRPLEAGRSGERTIHFVVSEKVSHDDATWKRVVAAPRIRLIMRPSLEHARHSDWIERFWGRPVDIEVPAGPKR